MYTDFCHLTPTVIQFDDGTILAGVAVAATSIDDEDHDVVCVWLEGTPTPRRYHVGPRVAALLELITQIKLAALGYSVREIRQAVGWRSPATEPDPTARG